MFCPWAKFLELLSDGSWQVRVGLGRKCQLAPLHFDPQSDSSMKMVPNGNGQIPRKSEGHSQNKGRGYWTGKKQQMFTTCIFVLSREKKFSLQVSPSDLALLTSFCTGVQILPSSISQVLAHVIIETLVTILEAVAVHCKSFYNFTMSYLIERQLILSRHYLAHLTSQDDHINTFFFCI